jgi:hypothetical protein
MMHHPHVHSLALCKINFPIANHCFDFGHVVGNRNHKRLEREYHVMRRFAGRDLDATANFSLQDGQLKSERSPSSRGQHLRKKDTSANIVA